MLPGLALHVLSDVISRLPDICRYSGCYVLEFSLILLLFLKKKIYLFGCFRSHTTRKNPPTLQEMWWSHLKAIPGSGRSPGGRHGNPLQCSCLVHPTDAGVFMWHLGSLLPLWIFCCGAQQLQNTDSGERAQVVVACQIISPAAYEIFLPQPGIKHASLALQGGFLTTEPPGRPLILLLTCTSTTQLGCEHLDGSMYPSAMLETAQYWPLLLYSLKTF